MEVKPEPDEIESFSTGRRWGVGLNVAFSIALFLAVVVMLNYLAARNYRRTNLNTEDPAELSAETRGLLEAMTNQVRVVALFEGDDPLFRHVWHLLREYRNINPGIRVEHVDFLRDPASHGSIDIPLPGGTRAFPCYEVAGEIVWGLTHRILTNFQAQTEGVGSPKIVNRLLDELRKEDSGK